MLTPTTLFSTTKEDHGVRGQDKAPQSGASAGSRGPATAMIQADASTKKQHGSEKRQTVHMSTRVHDVIHLTYVQIAKDRGGKWTPSSVLAEAAEEWLVTKKAEQFGQQLSTIVRATIIDAMDKRENREARLL